MNHEPSALHLFKNAPEESALPQRFTFPFRYEPHPLAATAAKEVQRYLENMTEWKDELDQGKMFGVLIVRQNTRIGFLAAYSGILKGRNDHPYFVPPVYDLLQTDGFFKSGEEQISAINRQINSLEKGTERITLQNRLSGLISQKDRQLETLKAEMKAAKAKRDALRSTLNDETQTAALTKESQFQKAEYKRTEKYWKEQIEAIQEELRCIDAKAEALKEERKQRSYALQQRIFSSFLMRNARGETQDLYTIFQEYRQSMPPAGAGECAAPKLLQYAYLHNLHPLAMAEFWWGNSPKTELRRHGYFYPACKSKCEPILSFMLQGLDVDPNPITEKATGTGEPDIIYEDEWMVAVNKPEGMCSVPGKEDIPSVYSWAKEHFPSADGPLIVHRLDMDTSGVLLIAKSKEAHFQLQKMFESRRIKKRYIALLNGTIAPDNGFIRLPLCPDPYDRPRQVVNAVAGKPAVTRFQVLSRSNGHTRIAFFPETGRTHQLRVHAAHHDGLNAPIVGDALYGILSDRLYLHAEELVFRHFATGQMLTLHAPAPF